MFKKILLVFMLLLCGHSASAEDIPLSVTPYFIIFQIDYKDRNMILFEGEMKPKSMMVLIDAMEQREITDLVINTMGGSLDEAWILGKYIEQRDISVYIPPEGACISACAFAIMKSNHIENDGNGILFHSPYLAAINPDISMHLLLQENAGVTIDMVEWFMEAGYSIDLLNIIYKHSDRNKFVVFQDPKFLEEFKVNEFSKKVEIKPEWFKIEER